MRIQPQARHTCAVVDVKHQRLGALDEDARIPVLSVVDKRHGVDDVVRQLLAVSLEAFNLLLDVVLEGVAEPLLVPLGELP